MGHSPQTRILLVWPAVALVLATLVAPAIHADTGMRLTAPGGGPRLVIDGFTSDFVAGEEVFGINLDMGAPEESNSDSKWGPDNDVNQIRITWDKDSLYVAGEGVIWNNNMMILLDTVPGRGLSSMQSLNSWRRNFTFPAQFAPDVVLATWDGNTNPHLLLHQGGSTVNDQLVGALFRASATFSQNLRGRAMEFAIPWNVLFLGTEGGPGTTPTYVPALGETVQVIPPPARTIRVAAVITAGNDGSGGPDSAPDNTTGHTSDANQTVVVDNYAGIDLDLQDDTGLGAGGADGVADWGVRPRDRVSFRFTPPLREVRLELTAVEVDHALLAQGDPAAGRIRFRYRLEPALDPDDPIDQQRQVNMTAEVYDLRGRLVRPLYFNECRRALDPSQCCTPGDPFTCTAAGDVWDGLDLNGHLVPPGVYVLRCEIETTGSRVNRSIAVIR